MKGKIVLVDLQVYERLTPLAAGLMAAAVLRDGARARALDVELCSWTVTTSAEDIARAVLDQRADLVGFSTYVWNARLVRRIAELLAAARPELPILLGGPHVVGQVDAWTSVARRVIVGNGEGEPILVDLAERLVGGLPLPGAAGVAGRWDGETFASDRPAAIADLDDIPSPFLTGVFPRRRYTQAILETNRGCPFSCSFCYWGLGDRKVRSFSDERVADEVDWICREGILSVFVADANFGMYPRDEQIARKLADHRKRRGTPLMVALNSMKNKPDRMVRIAEIVGEAGLATTQSMAIQSMDEATLKATGRGAIRLRAYEDSLRVLNQRDLTTYVELIWPLPGETLASFGAGIDRLCAMGAQSFVVYPLLVLPNTRIAHQAEAGDLAFTATDVGGAGDYMYVTATREVSQAEYAQGLWLVLALNLLYNARGLHGTLAHLRAHGTPHLVVLHAFAEWLASSDIPIAQHHARAVAGTGHAEWGYWGAVAHEALHAARDSFVGHVAAFARSQPWWSEEVSAYVEVDRLLLPWIYTDTPAAAWSGDHVAADPDGHLIRARLSDLARSAMTERLGADPGATVVLDRRRGQLPQFRKRSIEESHAYAYGQLQRVHRLVPKVTNTIMEAS